MMFDTLRWEIKQGGLVHAVIGGCELALLTAVDSVPGQHDRVKERYYRFRASDDVFEYDCPPDPFKKETTDPTSIQVITGRPHPPYLNRRVLFGTVNAGDWDRGGVNFEETDFFKSFTAHFVDGVAWENTELGNVLLHENARHDGTFDYPPDKREYLNSIDQLFERIRTNGFRPIDEIPDAGGPGEGLFLDTLDEITVDVGRDGELLFVDGKNRLAIAKILGLERVPIVFLVRHEEWLMKRANWCESGTVPNHPDLRDLR